MWELLFPFSKADSRNLEVHVMTGCVESMIYLQKTRRLQEMQMCTFKIQEEERCASATETLLRLFLQTRIVLHITHYF